MWITPPGSGTLWAELHSNSVLDRANLHIPLCCSAVEGSEDRGGNRPVSFRKRCPPKLSHLREECNRKRQPAIDLRPPGTNYPASSVREKEEASSAALIREHQVVRCAGGVRGPRRRTRWGSSHCDPQITLTMS